MTISLVHAFVSAKGDGPDTTKVQPSDWNAEHELELTGPGIIGRYTAGAGAAQHLTLGSGLSMAGGVLAADAAYLSLATGLIGEIKEYAGVALPTYYLWCNGAAVSRTTYASLFAAITLGVIARTTSGSAILTNANTNITTLGLIGAVVEGTGIPSGATIVSATADTITLSANATATSAVEGITVRIFPWGRGDGSTTFNVPDKRGRVGAGRDDMGGTNASRMNTINSNRLATAGGLQTHTLTLAQSPAHTHTFSDTDTATTNSEGSHNHGASTGGEGQHTHTGTTNADGNHSHGGATGSDGSHAHTYDKRSGYVAIDDGTGTLFSQIWQGQASASTNTEAAHTHTIGNSGTHTHTFSTSNAPNHTHSIGMDGAHTHTVSVSISGTTNSQGSGDAHNNLQPSIMVNHIIFAGA